MARRLTQAEKTKFYQDGYLVIPDFFSNAQELLDQSHKLLADIDLSTHPKTQFKSGKDDHVGDDYFLSSGTKVHSFFEVDAFDEHGQLKRPKEQSINKIGHALHELDPVFRKFTLQNPNLKSIARDLEFHHDPLVLQSMIICKQPHIGAQVTIHDDSTFLYTTPTTALGFWFALEDCTASNGCLSFLPGSHKLNKIHQRMVRLPGGGTGFVETGEPKSEVDWAADPNWRVEECKAGSLVLIHGSVLHRSEQNQSAKSRFIYTFHMIDNEPHATYDDRNWLQPTKEMPFARLYADYE